MIKWMKMELWAGGNHPKYPATPELRASMERRRQEYWTRFEAFRGVLPPALVEADQRLHDAELVEVHSDSDHLELRLTVRPWEQKAERWVFTGVHHHQWINHQIQLSGSPGFGDLGYSEIEPHAGGFSMAILCSSGLELVVRATGFRVEDVSRPFCHIE